MRARGPTYYQVLGVPETASAAEIRAAYRALAAQHHPDKHVGNPLQELAREKLVSINEAYRVLSNPTRRAEYDTELKGASPGRRQRGKLTPARALLRLLGTIAVFLLVLRLGPGLVRAFWAAPLATLGLLLGVVSLVLWWRPKRQQ